MRTAAAVLLVAGILALAESVVTLVWQEPVTALVARRNQDALADQLKRTSAALLAPVTASTLHREETPASRMAELAARLDHRAQAGEALGRIGIPRIGVGFVFVAGAGSDSLKKGPGHYQSTALPGQSGTVGVAGHRTTYLAPFRKLNRLRRGDRITMTMPYGRFSYTVKGSLVVRPSRIAVLRQLSHDRLVLTTCTPLFSAAKRLVVIATQSSAIPLGAAVGDPFPRSPQPQQRAARTGRTNASSARRTSAATVSPPGSP